MITFIPNTPLKINWSSPISQDLVACFPLNEGVGTTAYNPALKSYGILYNGAKQSPGPRGGSVFFDGSDDYLESPHNELINFDTSTCFSITFWMKATTSATCVIIDKLDNGPTYTGYQVHFISGCVATFLSVNNAGSNYISTSGGTAQNDGKWHHIAFTYDGSSINSGMNIYTDGVKGTYSYSGSISGSIKNIVPLNIARRRSTNNLKFTGYLSLISFYNRTLSLTEVQASYTNPGSLFLQSRKSVVFLPSIVGLKTYNGLPQGSIKTMNAVAIASVKTINGMA